MLCGPDLSEEIMKDFAAIVKSCSPITSADILNLAQHGKRTTRNYQLDVKKAGDEFFKMSLELGLEVTFAVIIWSSVRKP
jgi:hypothetical protein